jgi:uncharacterized alpha-E superfamily protein
MPLQSLILPRDFPRSKHFLCLQAAELLHNQKAAALRKEVAMLSDSPKRLKKTWEELTAAASMETDPEKLGTILEEILAALEERQRTLSLPQNAFVGNRHL